MPAFSSRSKRYQGGVVLLFLSTFVFIVGFSVPYWSSYKLTDDTNNKGITIEVRAGLWMHCYSVKSVVVGLYDQACHALGVAGLVNELQGSRALVSLCFHTIVINCSTSTTSPASHILEIGVVLSGLLGFFGCLVFVAYKAETRKESLSNMPGLNPSLTIDISSLTLGWGLYLTAIGCSLAIVSGLIIALNSNMHFASNSRENPDVIPMADLCLGQSMTHQGQAMTSHPVQGQVTSQGQGQTMTTNQGEATTTYYDQGQTTSQGRSIAAPRGQGIKSPKIQGQNGPLEKSEQPSLGPIRFLDVPHAHESSSNKVETETVLTKAASSRNSLRLQDSVDSDEESDAREDCV